MAIKMAVLLITIMIFIMIIKKVLDPKIVFLVGGVLMLSISHHTGTIVTIFKKLDCLTEPAIIIVVSFGFAEILKSEQYSLDTVKLFGNSLSERKQKAGFTSILIAVLATWVGSLSFLSANAACGMVGPIIFPILIRMGVPAELASASLISGAWGSIIHPGDINAGFICDTLKNKCHLPEIQVTARHILPSIVSILIIAFVLFLINKRNINEQVQGNNIKQTPFVKRVSIRAIISFIPFIILGIYSFLPQKIHFISSRDMVIVALLTGCIISLLFAKNLPTDKLTLNFFKGVYKGFKDVILLLIASKIFISGFVNGFGEDSISAWITTLGSFQIIAAILITFAFTIFTGSGDAIVTSIIGVFIPSIHSGLASYTASMIWFAGEIGRCASPVSAATLTISKIASADANKVALKTLLPISLGLLGSIMTLYLIKCFNS